MKYVSFVNRFTKKPSGIIEITLKRKKGKPFKKVLYCSKLTYENYNELKLHLLKSAIKEMREG